MKKVKSVLISQPKPEGKSPYAAIQKKHNLKIDYFPFMHVEEMTSLEFKEQRISLLNHDSVIFTSKNAMDHYFGMMEKLRLRIPDFTKYFCVSEAIAHYLQNFITYRKRKIFTGEQSLASLIPVMQKHTESKFLFPCSDVLKNKVNVALEESGLQYTKAQMYKVVCSDLSDLSDVKYDILVFFSPTGVKSLLENFPKFKQEDTRLAIFGKTTKETVEKNGLRVDILAPTKKAPSMSMALDQYIKEANKRKR
ncbi:MAG: uroporphyrinogen-III synthase [Flavobacteriales bacterium]|nr:uroporphyrinogen-III synthase [Flavobacteriales bacterium]MBO98177.1 uroporphyrinogen-III synthase [Flavobacteriales bacterium]|tara:strand:+ start:231 stop:983 length:753 start_codon:yes stop_codon:yes gene_type:complete